ncbi:hypothetical protein Rhow_009045 [Rhodococcus wratislaviensis]|uniref:Uncharacterized protein n=1 Tax=Rhodococcus wratislaviensis TaxID=44752 RepID=A0A402CM26_RHOWR|nr:hypothetical protein Rhow_009045 [Rhodococcus wratislaviensis]
MFHRRVSTSASTPPQRASSVSKWINGGGTRVGFGEGELSAIAVATSGRDRPMTA